MKKYLTVILSVILVLVITGCSSQDYEEAVALYNEGNYVEAEAIFTDLGNYKDSSEMANACIYNRAIQYASRWDYDIALELLEKCPDYKDSAQLMLDYKYAYGVHLAGLADPYDKPEIRESYTLKNTLINFYELVGMNPEYQRDLEKALYIFTELSDIGYGYNVDHLLDTVGYILAVYGE